MLSGIVAFVLGTYAGLLMMMSNSVTADIHGDDENIIVAAKYGYAIMNKKNGKLKYVKKTWVDEGEVKSER